MYGSEQAALVSGYWLELSSAQTLFEGAFEHRRQVHLLTLGVFVHAVAAECDVLNHGVHTIRSYVRIRQSRCVKCLLYIKKSGATHDDNALHRTYCRNNCYRL